MVKLDPYINVDPGTMSPFQHGEVYVTDDGRRRTWTSVTTSGSSAQDGRNNNFTTVGSTRT